MSPRQHVSLALLLLFWTICIHLLCTMPQLQSRNCILQIIVHKMCSFRSMKNLDQAALADDLTAVQWVEAMNKSSNVNDMVNVFNETFLRIWDKHAPIIYRRTRKRPTPWMNGNILESIHHRNETYKKFINAKRDNDSSSDKLYQSYKLSCAIATKAIQLAKRDFFMHGARSGSKFFWRHIKQATGFGKIKLTIKPWPCHDEQSAKASANRVNNNFVDTIDNLTQILNINCNSVSIETCSYRFKFDLVTTSDVSRIIDSMKNTPTVGSDFISLQMLRKSPVSVIKALTIIFNASMTNGVFPIAWKHSIVTPVFKKETYKILKIIGQYYYYQTSVKYWSASLTNSYVHSLILIVSSVLHSMVFVAGTLVKRR